MHEDFHDDQIVYGTVLEDWREQVLYSKCAVSEMHEDDGEYQLRYSKDQDEISYKIHIGVRKRSLHLEHIVQALHHVQGIGILYDGVPNG